MIVAAVQAAPVFLDTQRTLDRVLSLVQECAHRGAKLAVFPETFLPGYPIWVSLTNGAEFNSAAQKRAFAHYLDAAVEQDGPELGLVAEAARDLGIFVYLGFAERGKRHARHSIFCSLAAIHPEWGIVGVHRKLVPTYEERLVWGHGDGHGLRTHDWQGVRLGGLNCWENWLPLARQTLYEFGEDVHVAVWPGSSELTADISRFIALEGRVYVVSAGGLLGIEDIPDSFPLRREVHATGETWFATGGTRIVDPHGRLLSSVADREAGIALADIDPRTVREEKHNLDVAGHYSRPDVFALEVNSRRLETLV